jgi:hypothetical protein
VDTDAFIRDGFVAVRGAFDAGTARACRDMIWDSLGGHGVNRDPATWTKPSVEIDCPEGEPFAAAGTSPALAAAYDELIGPGRWTRRAGVGGAVPVRFPSEEFPGNCGYHIEGSFAGPGPEPEFWVNVRSRARGLLAIFLYSDVGPDDAPTRLVCGSHLYIPAILQRYGETGLPSNDVSGRWRPSVLCRDTAHATGEGRRRLPVPPVHRAHRHVAAPGHDATYDRPARRACQGRVFAGWLRSLTSSPGHCHRAHPLRRFSAAPVTGPAGWFQHQLSRGTACWARATSADSGDRRRAAAGTWLRWPSGRSIPRKRALVD